ncbi:MAG: succinate dehydrogenase, cytochrome b556 subunit [Proteobacteria bacterium]|nr:succinate dehydrogenase, cytochrome b556 subunit [Pseudomonadota bacterium]
MPSRPLSPHLGVYRFKYTLTTSILNRFTGAALSGGFLLLGYWLFAVASGEGAQQRAQQLLGSFVLKLFYAGLLFAFSYHLVAGIRHLVWDTGRGLERAQSQRSAWIVGIASVLLTLVLLWAFFCPRGAA